MIYNIDKSISVISPEIIQDSSIITDFNTYLNNLNPYVNNISKANLIDINESGICIRYGTLSDNYTTGHALKDVYKVFSFKLSYLPKSIDFAGKCSFSSNYYGIIFGIRLKDLITNTQYIIYKLTDGSRGTPAYRYVYDTYIDSGLNFVENRQFDLHTKYPNIINHTFELSVHHAWCWGSLNVFQNFYISKLSINYDTMTDFPLLSTSNLTINH